MVFVGSWGEAMKKAFVATVFLLTVLAGTAYAAVGPIMRLGIEHDGIANPGGCDVGADDVHPTELRVDCSGRTGATKGARVRFRFLKDVGVLVGPATVSADLHQIRDSACSYSWRGPVRTLRVIVPFGSYCHIRSATLVSQP
jgi:hypothetical protein